ncbi:MAG: nucleotidyltransferase family protein [Candidatus Ancaeobacter aquaticus]|nr:nucleotidyltransferase family protein [Candidatus Ancaeobacter aquaticus]
MKAVILAAGFATRLKPLTDNTAKPLLPIAEKKMIEYITDRMQDIAAIDAIYVITNEKFHNDFVEWKSEYSSQKDIRIINDGTTDDSNKKGAVGDINFLLQEEKLDDDLLIIGGDNLFDLDLGDFLSFACPRGITISVYDVGSIEAARKFGIVTINNENIIDNFEEKPYNPGSTLAAMCLYFIPKDKLQSIFTYIKEGNSPDQPGKYIAWLTKSESVYAYTYSGIWFDIGSFESYQEANAYWQKRNS